MTRAEILSRIRSILVEKIIDEAPPSEIGEDENLFQAGYISSLQMLDLVGHVETAFGISIPHYEVSPENFETAARLADYVTRKLGL